MNEVKWTDDLSVSVDLIDDQHKMLIEYLNNFASAVKQHQGPTEIAKTLNFLIEYTDFHFSMEERNMKAHNYPEYDVHKARHEEFKTTLAYMESEYRDDGPTDILAESIDILLVNWLLRHIRGTDVQFGAFLKDKGIVISEEE